MTLRRDGASPAVPPPAPSDDPLLTLDITPAPPAMDAAAAAADAHAAEVATLTDTIEYCAGALVRVARLPAGLCELVSKAAMGCVVGLMGFRRLAIVDAASRVIYAMACSHDPFVTGELAVSRDSVHAACVAAVRQVEAYSVASRNTAAPREAGTTTRVVASVFGQARGAQAPTSRARRAADVDADADVTSPLHRLVARTVLSLSNSPPLVSILVSCRVGDALMQLFRGPDTTASRWALLSLCELFQVWPCSGLA